MARRAIILMTVLGLLAAPACTGSDLSADEFCRLLSEPIPDDRWDGVDVIIHINPHASDADVDTLQRRLDNRAEIDAYVWVTQDEAYDEFVELFADQPEMVEAVRPEILPANARIALKDADPQTARRVAAEFEGWPGVYRAMSAPEWDTSVIEFSVRPLTSEMAIAMSIFNRGRTSIQLVDVAPSEMRDDARVLDEFWAAPEAAGTELERVAEAARQVAAYYDTRCE